MLRKLDEEDSLPRTRIAFGPVAEKMPHLAHHNEERAREDVW